MRERYSAAEKVCIGILGCGAISKAHLEAFCANAHCQVIACADVNLEAARQRAAQFDVPEILSPEELLTRADIDCVAILAPPKWHKPLLLQALENRKDILIEKPLALNLAEADEMVAAIENSISVVGVALMHRYQSAYFIVRELLLAGSIGPIKQVRFSLGYSMANDGRFRDPRNDARSWLTDAANAGGGMLMSSTLHFFSVVSFLLGEPAARQVTARLRRLGPYKFDGIEDDADLWIDFDNGTEFILRESWAIDIPYRLDFFGEDGWLSLTGPNFSELSMSGQCRGPLPEICAEHCKEGKLHIPYPQTAMPVQPLFRGLINDMIRSVRQRQPVATLPSARHARDMQAVVTAAYESNTSGLPVDREPIHARETAGVQ